MKMICAQDIYIKIKLFERLGVQELGVSLVIELFSFPASGFWGLWGDKILMQCVHPFGVYCGEE